MTGNESIQPEASAGGAGAPADLGPRILARLIDSVLLWAVIFIIIVPLMIAMSILGSMGGAFGGSFSIGSLIFGIIMAAIIVGYFAVMESQRGQTVGKMALGLKTVGPDGKNPTLEEAAKRSAWYALGIVPIIGGLLELAAAIYIMVTINQSPTKQGWHDKFAGGTSVIKTK
jgi:uncharacterized RDD family membrane protein YckC